MLSSGQIYSQLVIEKDHNILQVFVIWIIEFVVASWTSG